MYATGSHGVKCLRYDPPTMPDATAPVLIVGSGPAGLSAAVLLADLGVRAVLVERNPATTDHPRAHVINTRTMEIFRQIGIADAVLAAGIPDAAYARVLWKRTLVGDELGAMEIGLDRAAVRAAVSPTRIASCAQDNVEILLRRAAEQRGCDLRYATELIGYAQDGNGVVATLRTGVEEKRLRARWVIAADGASSPTRRLLDVGMVGIPPIATLVGIYFHADLAPWLRERPALLFFIMNSRAPGILIALDGRRRWIYHCPHPHGELTAEQATDAVRLAVGVDDLAVEIKSIRPWTMTAEVAERFRVGRVLLAGDAAHCFPPTGGFGLNTGVQDVHNLAWKLHLVLAGRAPESLLDTYEEERRPVAQANTDWSVRNFLEAGTAVGPGSLMATLQIEAGGPDVPQVLARLQADIDGERDHFDALGQDLGFVYERGALIPDGSELPAVADRAAEYVPNARPGSRAPHVWLSRGRDLISSLDLFGSAFTLLVPESANEWAAAEASAALPVEVRLHRIGPTADLRDQDGSWRAPYDITEHGAVLVRPDGHVACRFRGAVADPAAALVRALDTILGRQP